MAPTFCAIDVETANANRASICQIGVVSVVDGEIENCWGTLVNPESWFAKINVSIHGISENNTKDSPTMPDIYGELQSRLNDSVLISHTSFDRVALKRAAERYSLDQLQAEWLDSAWIVRRAWPEKYGRRGYGLKNIASNLGISFQHHDAVEDARAAAEIVLHVCTATETDISEWKPKISNTSSVLPVRRKGSVDGPLYGQTVAFTGTLSIPRREAADIAAQAGCNVVSGVTKKVTIVVVGVQDMAMAWGYSKSNKYRRAEQLIEKGLDIQMLSEEDFFELVSIN